MSAMKELVRVNQDLANALAGLHLGPAAERVRPDTLVRIQASVERGMACLRDLAQGLETDLQGEITDYLRHLQQLMEMLPSFYAGLQAEKRRLEDVARHLQSAAAWAQGRKETL